MRNVIVLTNDVGFCAVIRFRESDCFWWVDDGLLNQLGITVCKWICEKCISGIQRMMMNKNQIMILIFIFLFFLFRYSFSIILFRKIIYIYSKQNFNTKTSYYSFISNRNLTLNVKKFLLPRSQNYDISRDQSTFFQQGEKELYKGIMKFISVSKLVLKY